MSNSISFGFFIKLFNDLCQEMQTKVDIFSFLKGFAINASLRGAFRAGQIDEVQLGHSLHILAHLLTLQLDNEDAVGTSGCVVFWGFGHHTVGVTYEKKVQSVFFVFCSVHTQIL